MILRGAEHECGACGVVFHGLKLFDKHRRGPWEARYCRSPVELGLVQNERGTWYTPEGLENAQRLTGTLATARSRRTS